MINLHKLDNRAEALIENPTPPQPTITPQPVVTPRPTPAPINNPISNEEGVLLACRLYSMSKILNLLYQPLYSINFDPIFLTLMSENDRVSELSFSVNVRLGGRNNCRCQRLPLPILGGNVCAGFQTVYGYLDDMLVIANTLSRGGFGGETNIEILEIISLINSQKNAIENRIINCKN